MKNSIGEEVAVLNITLSKNELLAEFDWGSIVKKDIENAKEDLNIKELLIKFNGSIDNIHKGIIGIKISKILNAFKSFLSYCYRPELGLVSVGIISAKSIDDFRQGNANIHPIFCSNMKEMVDDLYKSGITKLNIEGQDFLFDILKDK